MFETDAGTTWRNFSIPWHDPAFDANTPLGKVRINEWLESQIRPVDAVLMLDSVYKVNSTRKWLKLEVGIARSFGKPVFALPEEGNNDVSVEVADMCDGVVPWDPPTIAATIERCQSVRPAPGQLSPSLT